jgi:transglutaminase-like putative cysteine protease
MRYKVRHTTEYIYQEIVSTCHNRVCLVPLTVKQSGGTAPFTVERSSAAASPPQQACTASDIKILPAPDELTYETDFFGNTILFFSIYKEHEKLEISSESLVNVEPRTNSDLAFASILLWRDVRDHLTSQMDVYADIIQYILPSVHVPESMEIQRFALDCFPEDATLWSGCQALMKKIYTSIEFKPGFTTVNTPVESVLKSRKGVCQDFAHLMIACLRNMGLPARYISGYIETLPPPGKEKLVGSDASHAWVSVYFPGIGWVEFDPTNNLLPSNNHIVIAYGRDYFDVAPLKGIIFSSGKQTISVKVDVTRVK